MFLQLHAYKYLYKLNQNYNYLLIRPGNSSISKQDCKSQWPRDNKIIPLKMMSSVIIGYECHKII